MTLRPLASLIVSGPAETPVAWRGDDRLCLGQFRADIAAIAAAYASHQAVALVCSDSYRFAAGLFGLLHAGVRVVLPPSNQPAQLEALRDRFTALIDDAAVAAAGAVDRPPAPLDAENTAIDFFTSGSSGAPKRIAKTLAMFEREVAMFEHSFGGALGNGRVFATVPHQHMYGMPFKLMWSLAAGRAFCADTHLFWETLLAELSAGDIVVSSPAHLGRMAGLQPLKAAQRPALVLSAGAPLSREASDDAADLLGCRPTEIFGSTETGAMATRSARSDENDPWHLLSGVTIRCDDEGRMAVQTQVVGPEWIETADVVTPTDDGFVYRGRADRIVKIEGKRIALAEVEAALCRDPRVESAAVVAIHRPPQLAAVVVPSAEGKQLLARIGGFRFNRTLRQSLARTIEPAGVPHVWRFVDAMPAHPMGKRRNADIAALFGVDEP